MSTYEPCVLGSDGNCTRWSHDHAADRPPVTDDARAVREAAMDLYRAMRRANPDAWAEVDEVEDWTYWDDIVRTAQVTLAAGRAETTTEEWPRCKASRDGGCDRCHDEHGRHIPCRAETTTATTEDTARAIHDRHCTSDDHGPHCMFWDEDYESAEALHARGLLATARTLPTREQIAEHLRKRVNDDEDHADRLYVLSADEWSRWYDEHLTVSHQIDGKSLRIEGRPETIADAVLALLRGGDG